MTSPRRSVVLTLALVAVANGPMEAQASRSALTPGILAITDANVNDAQIGRAVTIETGAA